jgi:hypothetical protein
VGVEMVVKMKNTRITKGQKTSTKHVSTHFEDEKSIKKKRISKIPNTCRQEY